MTVTPHRVAVLAIPTVVPFDQSIPGLVFGHARLDGAPLYEVRTCAPEPGPVAAEGDVVLCVPNGPELLGWADTVVIPGTMERAFTPALLEALRAAAARGTRLVSICTGAFALAAAGLLDGLPATTYWRRTEEFAAAYPKVSLDPAVLFVDAGAVLTSAGLAAGIDLCLHIVRTDHGAAVAAEAARRIVVAPVRPGGQAQFITSPVPEDDGQSTADVRAWALERLDRRLTLADLAREARVSVRTLTRRFHDQTGLSPLQWLLHRRVARARELLETTALPVADVARLSGLGTADSLRLHLMRQVGLTPTAYRSGFTRTP